MTSAQQDTLTHSVDLTQLSMEMFFEQGMPCGFGFLVCTGTANWIGNGQCPGCSQTALGRLICDACHGKITGDGWMRHKCGHRGPARDFFTELIHI